MTSVLLELLHHKTWATLRLIEFCQGLAPEHLDATVPGTYGTVRETLRHLLAADERYFNSVTGANTGSAPPEAGLGALAERFAALAKRWEPVMLDPSAPDSEFTTRWGVAKKLAPLAQSIHHADDHRTQVLTILGARGLEVPDLDVWSHGTELGFVHDLDAVPTG
jgi:uncharacterized damage-inducible protein DinB